VKRPAGRLVLTGCLISLSIDLATAAPTIPSGPVEFVPERLERAVRLLEGRIAQEGKPTLWHVAHALLARPSTFEDKKRFSAALSLGPNRRDSSLFSNSLREPHRAQFALSLGRSFPCSETFGTGQAARTVAEIVRHEIAVAKIPEIVEQIEKRLTSEIERVSLALERLPVPQRAIWRLSPEVREWKRWASSLDLSWVMEALLIDSNCYGTEVLAHEHQSANGQTFSGSEIVSALRRLFESDRELQEINFVPEFGVHMLGAMCRLDSRLQDRGVPEEDRRNSRDFLAMLWADIPSIPDRAATYDEAILNLDAHLIELFFDANCTKADERERPQASLERFLTLIENDTNRIPYGAATHALRGLNWALTE
jgi:hypothetical protein